jgi:hypothetical protein
VPAPLAAAAGVWVGNQGDARVVVIAGAAGGRGGYRGMRGLLDTSRRLPGFPDLLPAGPGAHTQGPRGHCTALHWPMADIHLLEVRAASDRSNL